MIDQAESTAPVETTEVDTEVVETKGEGSAPSGTEAAASGDDTSKEDTSSWTEKAQKRYDELTRERYEAAARADRAEYRLQEAQRILQEREAKPETVAPSDEYPTLESVNFDESAHRAAVAKFFERQAETKVRSVLDRERQQAARDQTEREWQRKQSEFIKSKPDYAQKVLTLPPYLLTDALAAEIKETGNPEIAYYLAENPEKLAEIAQLPPKVLAREIGRIEARLEAAKAAPPPVSKAPPPTAKIDTGEAVASVAPDEPGSDALDIDVWRKRRDKQEQKRRG